MARVELTRHLYEYFPGLAEVDLEVDARDVAGVIAELERRVPGFAFYVCDERGRLRQHVNVFVGDEMVTDRRSLQLQDDTQGHRDRFEVGMGDDRPAASAPADDDQSL